MSQDQLIAALFEGDELSPIHRTYYRGDYLSRAGDCDQNIYLIKSGAVHAYRITDDEEQTIRFGYQESIIVSLDSYYRNEPSEMYIQALRKSEVLSIPKDTLQNFVRKDAELLQLYISILEDLVVQQLEREIDLLTQSPLERYERVLKRSPQLFQEVPAKYIASYLRMSPETLSRLRNS